MPSAPLATWFNRALLAELVGDAGELTIANVPVRDGLVASFYPSGQVASFACYGGGTAAFAWALHLDEGVESGRAVLEHGSGGTADCEVYADGHYERFDAWSDASRPRPLAYAAWVRRWIAEIVDTARRRVERAKQLARARDSLPVRDDD